MVRKKKNYDMTSSVKKKKKNEKLLQKTSYIGNDARRWSNTLCRSFFFFFLANRM